MSGLFEILGIDPAEWVEESDRGESLLFWIGGLRQWRDGATAAEAGAVEFAVYDGEMRDDEVFVLPTSFRESNPLLDPNYAFDADLACSTLTTQPAPFRLPASVMYGDLTLTNARFSGHLTAAPTGMAIEGGTITAYLTIESLVGWLTDLADTCDLPDGHAFCEGIMILEGDPETVVQMLLLPILRGLDARVNPDGSVESECQADGTCNAVSVCFGFESEAVMVSGISP